MAELGNSPSKRKIGWTIVRIIVAIVGLVCVFKFMQQSAGAGLARLFSTSAIFQATLDPADRAVRFAPNDPEAHYTRALALVNRERLSEAVAELQQAIQLRPHHYYEWLDLGVTLDRLDDQTGAAAALRESIRLAPSFAQPHWQLGSLLYRQGRYDEAFAELRLGASSNPNLFEGMLDLAWVAVDSDVRAFEGLVQPVSARHHLELANFLAMQGKGADAARQVREAGGATDDTERTLVNQTITRLLAAQLFSDAYDAWRTAHGRPAGIGAVELMNGEFVEAIKQNDPGFGWQVTVTPNIVVTVDPAGPSAGARSLRIEFAGDSAPGIQLVHQLMLLQPNTPYSLSFIARSEDLVSGGPPAVLVYDAGGNATKILGQSKPLSVGTSEWTAYQVDFVTVENTAAASIVLQRAACSQTPCPIFGKLWLSKFSVTKKPRP